MGDIRPWNIFLPFKIDQESEKCKIILKDNMIEI